MVFSPIRRPMLRIASRVKNTPNGIFCIGNSEFSSKGSHVLLFGSFAFSGIMELLIYNFRIINIVLWEFARGNLYFCTSLNGNFIYATRHPSF